MNEEQLFIEFEKQYRLQLRENDSEFGFHFQVSDNLEGEMNITNIIFKVLDNNKLMDDEDFISADGEHRSENPFSADKIKYGISINSDFHDIVLDSTPKFVYIGIKKKGKMLQGNSISFIDNKLKSCIKSIDIRDSIINLISIECKLDRIDITGIYCCKIILDPLPFLDRPVIDKFRIIDSYVKFIRVCNCNIQEFTMQDVLLFEYKHIQKLVSDTFFKQYTYVFIDNIIKDFRVYLFGKFNIDINKGKYENIKLSISNKGEHIILNDLFVNSLEIKNNLTTQLGEVNIIKLNEIKNLINFKLSGGSSNEKILTINNPEVLNINKLHFTNSNFNNNFIGNISNIYITNNLVFNNIYNNGIIRFDYIEIFKYNKKIFKPINIESPTSFDFEYNGFYIIRSSLNNTLFSECTINTPFIVYAIDISKVNFINTSMPTKFINFYNGMGEKEAFQQMKIVAENKKDSEYVLIYRANELNSRIENIINEWKRESVDNLKSLFNFLYINLEEFLTLYLNQISNNHGISWIRTIKFSIVYVILIYSLFLISLIYEFNLSWNGVNFLFEIILAFDLKKYLTSFSHVLDFIIPGFIYPTDSKIEDLSKIFFLSEFYSLNWRSKLLIFINDIIMMPYIIYQFVAAFRKHGGK